MAFNVLIRAAKGEFLKALLVDFEDQPLQLVLGDAVDWSNAKSVESAFEIHAPCALINMFDGDDTAREIRCLENIVAQCGLRDVPLVHFSSYRVFGDQQDVVLDEASEPNPKEDSGKAAVALEQLCQTIPKYMILRVSWMMGGEFENILQLIVPKLLQQDTLQVSDHDYGSPVTVKFLSNVVLALVRQTLCGAENWGIFHVHSSDRCSEAELCDALVRLINAETGRNIAMPLVTGVGDECRIMTGNAYLQGRRLTNNFGIQLPSWRRGLKTRLLKTLEALDSSAGASI